MRRFALFATIFALSACAPIDPPQAGESAPALFTVATVSTDQFESHPAGTSRRPFNSVPRPFQGWRLWRTAARRRLGGRRPAR